MLSEGVITLRPLQNTDAPILAQLANNKKIWDNLRDYIPHPYTQTDSEWFIGLCLQENPTLTFAIEHKGGLCGVIGLVPQKDVYRKSAEIGYWIGEPFWNRGIATTAVKLISQYGFNELNMVRIFTAVFDYNPASMKVLEKNGYKKEAVFKKAVIKNGEIWDEHRYSKTV
jgi:[ribosomal protein S5]-alanine N-acetyltransferase